MQADASQLTRQVVSRAGTGGCNLRDGQLLAALSVRSSMRTGPVCPDIGTVPCLRKKFRVHQGTEQGIADGVHQDIRVGMTLQAFLIRDGYASDNQRSARDQRMHIESLTNSHI